MTPISKNYFWLPILAMTCGACVPNNINKISVQYASLVPISAEDVGKEPFVSSSEISIDGYIGRVCESYGKNGCRDGFGRNKIVIYGNPINKNIATFKSCALGDGEEILIDGYFSSKLVFPEGRRVTFVGKISSTSVTLPDQKKSNVRVLVKKEYKLLLEKAKLLQVTDEFCSSVVEND